MCVNVIKTQPLYRKNKWEKIEANKIEIQRMNFLCYLMRKKERSGLKGTITN